MMTHIETTEQFQDAIQGDRVLVDFYAAWCGPCRMMATVLEEIAEEKKELSILKVNVDELSDVAAEYNVSSIPMLLLIKNGKVVATQIGFLPKASLLRAIDKFLD